MSCKAKSGKKRERDIAFEELTVQEGQPAVASLWIEETLSEEVSHFHMEQEHGCDR